MTTRTFIDKNGNEWSWEETPEVKKVVEKIHAGDYQRPLYAPHPDLKKNEQQSPNS